MKLVVGALIRGWNLFTALLLQQRGRWRLRRGDPEGAARFLEAAAARAPGTFSPLLHLSRAHLRRRDLARARGALARAREISPARFDREAGPWMRAEGFDLSSLADMGPGTRPESPVGPGVPVERRAAVLQSPQFAPEGRSPEGAPGRARARRTGAHPMGDCKDLDEYTRFRSMPPITSGEIEAVDWDAVAEDLQDG